MMDQRLRLYKILFIIFFQFICFIPSSHSFDEYSVKAVILEKFAAFIYWPPDRYQKSENFIIAVLGDSFFYELLEKNIYKDYKINKKNVKILFVSDINQIPECNILYITKSMENKIPKIIEFTSKKPILTICETEGCSYIGVHINLYITNRGTLHFEINESKIKEAGLKINFLLLNNASKIIGGQQDVF